MLFIRLRLSRVGVGGQAKILGHPWTILDFLKTARFNFKQLLVPGSRKTRSSSVIRVCYADPHHLNVDPTPAFHLNVGRDPTFHFIADLDQDPDPASYQRDANLRPLAYIPSRVPF
jgi:hypothetical protein